MSAKLSKRTLASIFAASLLALAVPAIGQEHAAGIPEASKVAATDAALRDLWVAHAFWVRNVALASLAGNHAAAKAAEDEVVANARQIAAAIEPFYGQAAQDKLFGLLAGHYAAVKDFLNATLADSKARQEAAIAAATANADAIAGFLSGANPNLEAETLKSLLIGHFGHHVQQIEELKAKQYAAEAKTWAAMKGHMYVIADALAGALAKQFPAKFLASRE